MVERRDVEFGVDGGDRLRGCLFCRIRAVVSQVPAISGYEQGLRREPPDAFAAREHQFDEDERA